MPGTKVHLFPSIPSITDTTQLYTQRRSAAESPANYRFTIAEVMDYLQSQGFIRIAAGGPYDSDTDAASGGVAIGEYYILSSTNDYGIPTANGGLLKQRIN